MKTLHHRWISIAALATSVAVPQALAIFGAADTTVIIGDATDVWKWPRELVQWTTLIQNTRQQVEKADQMIRLAGDPKDLAGLMTDSIPDLMKPLDDAIGLETRQHALAASRELYSLGHVAVQTYDDAKKVGPNLEAYGETIRRDPKRYARFVFEEAMNARYKKAVANAEAVEKHEAKIQSKAMADLKGSTTNMQMDLLNATITASKARVDLAQQKAAQAKGELDAFHGELLVEDARKAEADREWAETVVKRMRDKALAAYQAQFPASGASGGGDAEE